jgi:hypothetical protein
LKTGEGVFIGGIVALRNSMDRGRNCSMASGETVEDMMGNVDYLDRDRMDRGSTGTNVMQKHVRVLKPAFPLSPRESTGDSPRFKSILPGHIIPRAARPLG